MTDDGEVTNVCRTCSSHILLPSRYQHARKWLRAQAEMLRDAESMGNSWNDYVRQDDSRLNNWARSRLGNARTIWLDTAQPESVTRIMKTSYAAVLLVFTLFSVPSAMAQGGLTPPSAPGPIFRTLQQVEPRIPIDTVPSNTFAAHFISQPGAYYLTTNLNLNGDREGIRVSAQNVTIDLNGFTIFGHSNNVGIYGGSSSVRNIRIHNGVLSRWASGIDFGAFNSISNVIVEDIRIEGGVTGATNRPGISVNAAGVVRRCTVFGNVGPGTAAIDASASGSVIEHCSVFNAETGIRLVGQGRVENCWVQNAASIGISATRPSTIRNNHLLNCGTGISVISNSWVAENLVDTATVDGIRMTASNNRIERNTVQNSASGYRMGNVATTNFVIQNISQRNVGAFTFVGGSIIGGPIVTVSSNVTVSSPWVNFSIP